MLSDTVHPYDSNQHPYFIGTSLALIVLNFVVFFKEPAALQAGRPTASAEAKAYVDNYAFIPHQLHEDLNGEPVRGPNDEPLGLEHIVETMFTAMFIHLGWLHILSNMAAMVFVGPRVEGRLGSGLFLLLYFASGILGWLFTYITGPGAMAANVGASGAVAGILGAGLITDPTAMVWLDVIPLPLWIAAPLFFIREFWAAFKAAPHDFVAHWAHVAGALVGLASGLALVLYKPAKVSVQPAPGKSHPPSPAPTKAAAPTPAPGLTPPSAAAAAPAKVQTASGGAAQETIRPPHPAATSHAAIPPPPAVSALPIKRVGAPASPHPPIAPRTPLEAHVNSVAASRIRSHVRLVRWLILAVSAFVLVWNALNEGIGVGILAGVLTALVLFGIWTGCEHLVAHLHVRAKTLASAKPTP